MDGTLVDSEPEILAIIEKSLASVGVKMKEAETPLRIGPPVKAIIRNSFSEEILSDAQLDAAVKAFRKIYDSSDYESTLPYEGIDELIHDSNFVHHVITNKPDLATNRILERKGWSGYVADVLTPHTLEKEIGHTMTKPEMFRYCRDSYPDVTMVGIGDMALDAESAISIGVKAIGVLWGTGSRNELEDAGCQYIVEHPTQLKVLLYNLSNE
jgi:phosphoglycolate phosphatase